MPPFLKRKRQETKISEAEAANTFWNLISSSALLEVGFDQTSLVEVQEVALQEKVVSITKNFEKKKLKKYASFTEKNDFSIFSYSNFRVNLENLCRT